jgi:signal transduction histidine kinase
MGCIPRCGRREFGRGLGSVGGNMQAAGYAMNRKLTGLSSRYQAALRQYLEGTRASLRPARKLGDQAVALRLETLDVVRIHKAALAALASARCGEETARRADVFFAEVVTPIEQLHHAARLVNIQVQRLSKTLGHHTVALETAQQHLKQAIDRRKAAERALKQSGYYHVQLLRQSQRLQRRLRWLARQLLLTHEDQRCQLSRGLHDDLAQTLLGIQVRLLTLKSGIVTNASSLKKEIARTQCLVKSSARTMARFAREFDRKHAA